jgi:hypothetical protein
MGKLEWLLSGLSATGQLVLPGVSPKERPAVVVHDNRFPEDVAQVEANYPAVGCLLPIVLKAGYLDRLVGSPQGLCLREHLVFS